MHFAYCITLKVVLKVTLPYNKAFWVIQKEMHMDGAQARPTSYCALPYAGDHENSVQAQNTLSEIQLSVSILCLLLQPATF